MKIHLLNLLTVLSLLLCVAVCVLWARSYGDVEAIGLTTGKDEDARETYANIVSLRGLMAVELVTEGNLANRCDGEVCPTPCGGWSYRVAARPTLSLIQLGNSESSFWNAAGFGVIDSTLRGSIEPYWWWRNRGLVFPHGFAAAVTSLLPFIRFVALAATKWRFRPGLCLICGYDLRATQCKCPECGHLPDAVGQWPQA